MHTQKVLIYACAFVTSLSALVISHNVKQDSEEFIRQSANIVEAPWRMVAVPPVSVPKPPAKVVAAISLTQNEPIQKPVIEYADFSNSPERGQSWRVNEKSIYRWVDMDDVVHYTDMHKGERVSQ